MVIPDVSNNQDVTICSEFAFMLGLCVRNRNLILLMEFERDVFPFSDKVNRVKYKCLPPKMLESILSLCPLREKTLYEKTASAI